MDKGYTALRMALGSLLIALGSLLVIALVQWGVQ